MAVLTIKSEPACKLCRSENRGEIDTLLELRSNLTRDPVTKKLVYTLPIVLGKLAELGIENPTEENVKNHWKKHCEKVSDDSAQAVASVALAKIQELSEGGQHADTDENLRLVGSIWRAAIEDQLARGEVPKVSTEHMLKASAELTRRAASETQHQLLTMFGQGLAAALSTPKEPKQIEGAEVIEAEYTEVEA